MNSTKPKNWRTYYGYKPPSLRELGKLTPETVQRQEVDYVEWLAGARGLSKKKAEAYARSFRFGAGSVTSQEAREAAVRQEEYLPNGAIVRRVKCYSAGAQLHYGMSVPRYASGEPRLDWHRLAVKPDAPTTYAVLMAGRVVNSFLSRKAARDYAASRGPAL
jgi:hypothetical protein